MTKLHPEVFRDVLTEFRILHDKNPEIDGTIKWRMAQEFVHTKMKIDSAIIRGEIALGVFKL